MNREIEYRAWNKTTETMVNLFDITPLALSDEMNTQLALQKMSGLFIPLKDDLVLMQYVNLKDNNNRKVFEDDIVSWEEYQGYEDGRTFKGIYIVKWHEECLRFDFYDPYNNEWFELANTEFKNVIGNIWTNPEIIKVEQND